MVSRSNGTVGSDGGGDDDVTDGTGYQLLGHYTSVSKLTWHRRLLAN
jgi:hypothetical protein